MGLTIEIIDWTYYSYFKVLFFNYKYLEITKKVSLK